MALPSHVEMVRPRILDLVKEFESSPETSSRSNSPDQAVKDECDNHREPRTRTDLKSHVEVRRRARSRHTLPTHERGCSLERRSEPTSGSRDLTSEVCTRALCEEISCTILETLLEIGQRYIMLAGRFIHLELLDRPSRLPHHPGTYEETYKHIRLAVALDQDPPPSLLVLCLMKDQVAIACAQNLWELPLCSSQAKGSRYRHQNLSSGEWRP
jgi:hypothetical protein